MINPEDIKDVPCSCCGTLTAEDELQNADHDWGLCYECEKELEKL